VPAIESDNMLTPGGWNGLVTKRLPVAFLAGMVTGHHGALGLLDEDHDPQRQAASMRRMLNETLEKLIASRTFSPSAGKGQAWVVLCTLYSDTKSHHVYAHSPGVWRKMVNVCGCLVI
jgi:hypothetical protein